MADEQQKALITELMGIREGMATKTDLVKLEEGLTGIIIKLAESVPSRTAEPPAQDSSPSKYKMDKLQTEVARLTERVDRLSNWYQKHTQLLELFNQRLERLEDHVGSATQTEQTATSGFIVHRWDCNRLAIPAGSCSCGASKSIPTRTPELPAQDSIKTNTEEN